VRTLPEFSGDNLCKCVTLIHSHCIHTSSRHISQVGYYRH
jgi:hypothetical protein